MPTSFLFRTLSASLLIPAGRLISGVDFFDFADLRGKRGLEFHAIPLFGEKTEFNGICTLNQPYPSEKIIDYVADNDESSLGSLLDIKETISFADCE